MQTRCNNCQKWNTVDENSKYCSCCGTLFSIDVQKLITLQKSVVKNVSQKIDRLNLIPMLSMAIMGALAYFQLISNSFFLGSLLIVFPISMIIFMIGSIRVYNSKKKDFPEIYNNPNWKP